MKTLIICPNTSLIGGVPAFFHTLKKFLTEKDSFLEIGKRRNNESFIFKPRNLLFDCLKLNKLLRQSAFKYDLVHINPSFGHFSLIRDALLLKITKNYEKTCVVFFHGIDNRLVKIVETFIPQIFFSSYNIADAFIVLSKDFRNSMRKWGFKQPIFVETTPVDDHLIQGFSLYERINKIRGKNRINLLFLARIEKSKGIIETIKAMGLLSKKHPNLHLIVAGDGNFLNQAISLSKQMNLEKRVSFVGYVKGQEKKTIFLSSDIYVFPSYYGEGMPTSVLEAMAFGLPVVTRAVGGLKDIFIDGQHGFMTESKDPTVIASLIEKIILDDNIWQAMSIAAYKTAMERFLASKVARRLEGIYESILDRRAI